MYDTIRLHGSLGDHILYTGLPRRYYIKYGKKLGVHSNIPFLWKDNPYCVLNELSENVYKLRYERCGDLTDWTMYRPYRVFCELTGEEYYEPDKFLYCPDLHITTKKKVVNQVVICDEAGWDSRRGYQHFDELTKSLICMGVHVIYHRHSNYGPQTIHCIEPQDLSLPRLTDELSKSLCFIGYDSGLMHLSCAVQTPQIILFGGTPSNVIAHDSTIFFNGCKNPCTLEHCDKQCLTTFANVNKSILLTVESLQECLMES